MKRKEALDRQIPNQFLKPVLPSPRYLKSNVVDGDHNGDPLTDPQLVLLDCDLPRPIVQEHFPKLGRVDSKC